MDVILFGIVDERTGHHSPYLHKEGRKSGSIEVISMVHHYLSEVNPTAGRARKLILWMDSCGGQNRNQYVLHYLYSRIMNGYHEEIFVKFMVVGHTRFSPDRGFGRIHLSTDRCDILTLPELLEKVNGIQNMLAVVPPASAFRNWIEYLKPHFHECKGIKTTDVIAIKLERSSNVVKLSWASRQELGNDLIYKEQPQLMIVAKGNTRGQKMTAEERKNAIEKVKELVSFCDIEKIPSAGEGLIKYSRKEYLLNLLTPILNNMGRQDCVEWWQNLECEERQADDDEQGSTEVCVQSRGVAAVPPQLDLTHDVSGSSFSFLTDSIVDCGNDVDVSAEATDNNNGDIGSTERNQTPEEDMDPSSSSCVPPSTSTSTIIINDGRSVAHLFNNLPDELPPRKRARKTIYSPPR